MQVTVLEPRGLVWEGKAKRVVLPASEGEMCVMDFHQTFFVRLIRGRLRYPGGEVPVFEGIAAMKDNTLRVFIERGS